MAATPQQRRLRALAAQIVGAHAAEVSQTLVGASPSSTAASQQSVRRIVGPPAGTRPAPQPSTVCKIQPLTALVRPFY